MQARSIFRPAPVAALLLVCVFATPALAAWPTSVSSPAPVCTQPGSQSAPVVAADGSGGAYVAWLDNRAGSGPDIYVTRMVDGAPAPGWPIDGLAVCTAPNDQSGLVLVPGESGDLFLVWVDARPGADREIYAQRVLADGTFAPGWPANGLALTNDSRRQYEARACSDGAGGFYATWTLEYAAGVDYDIYATHVLPAGTFAPGFVVNGLAINGLNLIQRTPDIAADGAGNAIIAYESLDGAANPVIWAQKLTPTGGRVWGAVNAGVTASYFTNRQVNCRVVSDGRGGALIARDFSAGPDTYPEVVFMSASGAVLDLADANATGEALVQSLAPDGQGGAWIVSTSGAFPVKHYLLHMDAGGGFPVTTPGTLIGSTSFHQQVGLAVGPDGSAITAWLPPTLGGAVGGQHYDFAMSALWNYGADTMYGTGPGTRFEVACASDGADGAIVAWSDSRGLPGADIYCTRVDRFGVLGDAAPSITRIADVPNDQGGAVSLQWTASYKDASPGFPITRYSVWRRVPGGLAAMRAGEHATVLAPGEPRPESATRVLRAEANATSVVYWEYVAAVPARGYAGYSAVVPTTSDSMPGSNPRTAFRVEAETWSGVPYWDSAPDSAYSVDNLPPLPPAPFTGAYAGGTTTLTWGANAEADLYGYRLYRGTSPGFVPSLANRVSEPASAGYVDVAGAPYVYKLSAVDVHGNESAFATLVPNGVTGADEVALPRELSLAAPQPNPAPGATLLRFALPRASAVSLAVYDASGRRVRTLAEGAWPAGEQSVRWDGRGESGDRVGAGLYFVRLQSDGRVLQRRVALLP